MNQLLPYAATGMIDQLKAAADAIFEEADGTTYLGFCLPGTVQMDENAWSIMRISSFDSPSETFDYPALLGKMYVFMWAEGICMYNLAFIYLKDYNYQFKKF